MKHVFRNRHNVRKTVMRDAHLPERIYVKTETNDKPVVERNQAIRSAELLRQDSRNPLVDGDVIAFSFQFPTVIDYELAKKKDPDIFDDLLHGNDHERTRAAERIQILYPGYITITKRNDAVRRMR